jgi:hypothetical protein
MKKIWSVFLITVFLFASFGYEAEECASCSSNSPSHCAQQVTQVEKLESCHQASEMKTMSCCAASQKSEQRDCQLCEVHDEPVFNESSTSFAIKLNLEYEHQITGSATYVSSYIPVQKGVAYKYRGSPKIASLFFLEPIRLLC